MRYNKIFGVIRFDKTAIRTAAADFLTDFAFEVDQPSTFSIERVTRGAYQYFLRHADRYRNASEKVHYHDVLRLQKELRDLCDDGFRAISNAKIVSFNTKKNGHMRKIVVNISNTMNASAIINNIISSLKELESLVQ